MNNKVNNWLLGIVLVAAVIVSAAGWAMGPMGGADQHDPGKMMGYITAKLDLSDVQQTQVESLLVSSREASAGSHQRLQALRQELVTMRADFDAGRASEIADEIGQLTSQFVYQFSSTFAEVYQLLDAEQRAELEQMMEHREKRRGRWHRGGSKSVDD